MKVDSTGLHMGTYFVSVEATAVIDSGGSRSDRQGNDIPDVQHCAQRISQWRFVDLDKAIEQLIYIARESELAVYPLGAQ